MLDIYVMVNWHLRKSVRVFSRVTKTNNEKSPRKTLKFGWESLQISEKENSDNLDQFLNIDNLPEGGLQVKVILKINFSGQTTRITQSSFTSAKTWKIRLFPNPVGSTASRSPLEKSCFMEHLCSCLNSRLNPHSGRNLTLCPNVLGTRLPFLLPCWILAKSDLWWAHVNNKDQSRANHEPRSLRTAFSNWNSRDLTVSVSFSPLLLPPLSFLLSPQFSRGQNIEICAETPGKRLLRRLRQSKNLNFLNLHAPNFVCAFQYFTIRTRYRKLVKYFPTNN